MGAFADQQRSFLLVVRPAASAVAAAGLVAAALLAPAGHRELLFGAAVAVVLAAALYALAGRYLPPVAVVRTGLVLDTAAIAAAGVLLHAPLRLAVAYLWPIGAGAVLLGGLDTLVLVALSVAATAVTPYVAATAPLTRVVVPTDIGLALLGAALALATRPARLAQAALAARSEQDAAALRISERIRASLDLDAVLRTTVAELARSLDATACSLRLAPDGDREPVHYDWPETDPADGPVPAGELARAALETDGPAAVPDVDAEDAPVRLRELLVWRGLRSGCGFPIVWGDRAIAAVGLASRDLRDWERVGVPLLERLGPQLAAALAQAEAYEQQQRTIAELEEFNEARQQLVAAVSHELRTPVTATLGFVETLLRRPQLDEDERRRFLHEAAAGARRLALLVDDLLVLTRTERRTLPLQQERVEPTRLLDQALSGLIVPAGRHVRLVSSGDCAVAGDPDRLTQVLVNLISNAIEHGEGDVTVSCREHSGRVVVEVEDEGTGVPGANVEQLFVPFARWGESEGTGLGLAISRGLAEAHGGSLDYRAPMGARGHAFVLELPAARAFAPTVA